MKEKKLWVYEFYAFGEGEEPEVKITVQEVDVICERRFLNEVMYYEVEGRHKGINVNSISNIVSTDNKRVKKLWLERRNDRIARTIYKQYLEEMMDFYDSRTRHLKEIITLGKITGVETIE